MGIFGCMSVSVESGGAYGVPMECLWVSLESLQVSAGICGCL